MSVDASERLRCECQVYGSCGTKSGNRMLAEHDHQAKALIDSISGPMVEQQSGQETNMRELYE
eukprot:5767169-Prorocentrum_lima.AAC.1